MHVVNEQGEEDDNPMRGVKIRPRPNQVSNWRDCRASRRLQTRQGIIAYLLFNSISSFFFRFFFEDHPFVPFF